MFLTAYHPSAYRAHDHNGILTAASATADSAACRSRALSFRPGSILVATSSVGALAEPTVQSVPASGIMYCSTNMTVVQRKDPRCTHCMCCTGPA